MKITKLLLEDVEEIDLANSVKDIADEVDDAADGELTPEAAQEIAAEIKEVGEAVNAEEAVYIDNYNEKKDSIDTKNAITSLLDRALAYALKQQELGLHSMGNVLISGLPGSGKTAIVENWCRARGINCIEINAKDNDLEAFINGFTVRDDTDRKAVTKAFSNTLDDLKREDINHVIFLDELNRQTKDQIRGSLLTLVNNKTIQAAVPGGKHYFKTLLFTVACINPSAKSDPGAAKLFQAEKTRYLFKTKNAHSDAKTTDDFLLKYYDRLIQKLNPKHPNYREFLEDFLRIQHLGRFIVGHRLFKYDGEGMNSDEVQQMLNDIDREGVDLFNQRMLFELLKASDGKIDMFKELLDSSDFLADNMDMLRAILDEYHEPKFEDLCAAKGIDLSKVLPVANIQPETSAAEATGESGDEDEDEINFDDYAEDDDEFFTSGSASGTTFAVTPTVVRDKIKSACANW